MKSSCIYKIQSKCNPERVYIGSAVNISDRWRTHLNDLRKNKHHSIQLQRHYNKHGEIDLIFTVIEPCLPEFLITREQSYLKPLPYFNTCPKAGSLLGFKASEETKKKMSETKRGERNPNYMKHPSKETIQKMHITRLGNTNCVGRILSESSRQKMKDAAKNKKPVSEQTRLKMSKSHKGVKKLNYKPHRHTEVSKMKIAEANRKRKGLKYISSLIG